ncbi:MAG: PilZ domain-containing protein [Terracidiphilus sp.]
MNNEQIELRRVECFLTESLFKRILRRVFPDRRKQERLPVPPLVGYLGTVSSSKQYDLGDISLTGFCLLTDERWIPGTEMPITLQRTNLPQENDNDSFTVQATVVRCDKDGVGFSIVLCEEDSLAAYGNPLRVKWVTRAQMEQFLQRLKEQPESQEPAVEGPIPAESTAVRQARPGARLKAAFDDGN